MFIYYSIDDDDNDDYSHDHDDKSQAMPLTNKLTNKQEGAAAAVLVANLTSL